MRKIKGTLGILLFGLVGLANTSHAALNDLGNGLVNDDVLNITWMQDANLFKTLCDVNDPIATGFTPIDTADAATVCTNNGAMTWHDAEAWIARLNAQSYLGFTDWRQPITAQADTSCEYQITPAGVGYLEQRGGHNCTGSELGNLFNVSLNNPNDAGNGSTGGTVGTNCYGTAPHCFQNTAPFSNAQSFAYWSGSPYAPSTVFTWAFHTGLGDQGLGVPGLSLALFVWPVRSGQSVVAPATPVPTLSLWGLGIMSLLLGFVARRKVR
jgi:hypothetical protein